VNTGTYHQANINVVSGMIIVSVMSHECKEIRRPEVARDKAKSWMLLKEAL